MTQLGDAYGRLEDPIFNTLYRARCHCGAVCYEVQADPLDAKLCHCRNCQVLHGAPMQWAAIFEKSDVRFVSGVECLRFYSSEQQRYQALAERSLPCKVSCGDCGTLIADEGRRMWLAFPTLFEFDSVRDIPGVFLPRCHIFYGQRVRDVEDGLPKWAGHKGKSALLDLP